MKTIVWYGAGKNLKNNFDSFASETGIPACICDRDEKKQNTQYKLPGGDKCSLLMKPCQNIRIVSFISPLEIVMRLPAAIILLSRGWIKVG